VSALSGYPRYLAAREPAGADCSAPAPIDLLYELRATRPDLFSKLDVMIDGGVRSGADVVKAVALGAKAVGLGRPFLYANGTHGQEGVERVCESELAGSGAVEC
jgi:L-lactate dehydrogenase (cytochrome)